MEFPTKQLSNFIRLTIVLFFITIGTTLQAQVQDTVYVDMAAINQPFMYNRMGAAQPTGMIFALTRDLDTKIPATVPQNLLGNVRLRADKRPRPIMLRANKGNVLKIRFTNLLAPYDASATVDAYNTEKPATVNQGQANGIYPKTRAAGVHILGTEMIGSIASDGSWSGANDSSLANPGETVEYILRVPEEGAFMLYSTGATNANGGQPGGQLTNGLFGSLTVQPEGAEWYRSQVTEDDLQQAITYYSRRAPDGSIVKVAKGEITDIYSEDDLFPNIDYDATYPDGSPILKMYKQVRPNLREIIHTDLTAIITGPNRGNFVGDSPSFAEVPASPNRRQPYREFGIHYHESPWTVQAFPVFFDKSTNQDGLSISNTLKTGVDGFSINYGSGGIGAEIYANRIGVGPMADCSDCAYEEFFLSSWAVGDPSTVVDVPANAASIANENQTQQNQFLFNANNSAADKTMTPLIAPKATKVLYADDPSNVYHSYMNDHVKFRVTHAGAGLTHVHHQHAAQWLHSPNSDEGHYLDSQAINPGSSYTLEMVYDGSGNLNKTVGDQIFHCHFYPHFAAGMWSMWRVHDVLELGTELKGDGSVAPGARALPDGEITTGTPIPGLVPIPTLAMAPVPSKTTISDGQVVVEDTSKNPGYPFYIPGIAGSRPPHPPLDFAQGPIYNTVGDSIAYGSLNGGLPRNVIYKARVPFENHTTYDWTKIMDEIQVIELPEGGTAVEKVAMDTHAKRNHPTLTPEGSLGNFVLNGLPPAPGAPYADPRVNLKGDSVGTKRTYKAANIQLDVVLNKKGWHFPQQRIISLWGDVAANIDGKKAPEPFYFRANSKEYIEYWHTNLVPEYYELDDYQVRTPTDIIGQHIHLVKFDVTSSDGAANGWNYEDGTLAPDMVRHRIEGINDGGVRYDYKFEAGKPITNISGYTVNSDKLEPHAPNPIWGKAPEGQDWTGAQTTIQRWYADPLLNNRGEDRTLRTVFTHDHFGPSTHQQVGLYAGLLVEPSETNWFDPITGTQLSTASDGKTRPVTINGQSMNVSDGGPTSWQANVVYTDPKKVDESYREFMLEFQDTQQAYLPDSRETPDTYPTLPEPYTGSAKIQFLDSVSKYRGWMDPTKVIKNQGYPELVSFGFRGTYSMNYRNEPLPLRASYPNTDSTYIQASGAAGNLASIYNSQITRQDPTWNTQPVGGSLIPGSTTFRFPEDPLGAGMEPGDPYTPLFRAYANDKIQIRTLVGAHVTSHFFNVHGVNWLFEPSNENSGYRSTQNMGLSEHFEMNFQLPVTGQNDGATDYLYETSADVSGRTAGMWGLMRAFNEPQSDLVPLPNNDVTKNPISELEKNCGCPNGAPQKSFDVTAVSIDKLGGSLVYNETFGYEEDDALVFVKTEDYKAGTWQGEPLVLRANAGDCISVKLTNDITPGFSINSTNYSYTNKQGVGISTNVTASSDVGLHAELLSYDVSQNDGTDIGFNTSQTVAIGDSRTYEWYAGRWEGNKAIPVEFGSVVLTAPDPLEQYAKGLFGALVIEPQGATWKEDEDSPSSANVYDANGTLMFREFVMQFQDNISVSNSNSQSITYAMNYKSEPFANRLPDPSANLNGNDLSGITSNSATGGGNYPATPRFVAKAGDPLRLRLLHPGGSGNTETFNLHGHVWQEEPYTDASTKLGYNDKSQWFGFRDQVGPLNSFDLLIDSAGGADKIPGDYLYGSMLNLSFQGGIWGLMTVTDGQDYLSLEDVEVSTKKTSISGDVSVDPETGELPEFVSLTYNGGKTVKSDVNPDGTWAFSNLNNKRLNKGYVISSPEGARIQGTAVLLEGVQRAKALMSENAKKPYAETPKVDDVKAPYRNEGEKKPIGGSKND
ncbi:MAG: multicopper oxidase [Aureisphaera sp.]